MAALLLGLAQMEREAIRERQARERGMGIWCHVPPGGMSVQDLAQVTQLLGNSGPDDSAGAVGGQKS